MKKYPSPGNGGKSQLPNGHPAGKDDAYFEAIGTLDELSSAIGWVAAVCTSGNDLTGKLEQIQRELFELGNLLRAAPSSCKSSLTTGWLERDIALWSSHLGQMKGFVLPAGCELACRLHLARVVCRRAERRVAGLGNRHPDRVPETVLRYLNRLSDWFYAAARWANSQVGISEISVHLNPKTPSKD